MNTFAAAAYRDLVCLAAAALITLMVGTGFAQATASKPVHGTPTVVVHGAHA
jgi:hypothetical protein